MSDNLTQGAGFFKFLVTQGIGVKVVVLIGVIFGFFVGWLVFGDEVTKNMYLVIGGASGAAMLLGLIVRDVVIAYQKSTKPKPRTVSRDYDW